MLETLKRALDKMKMIPNLFGWLVLAVGLFFIFMGAQVSNFTKTDVNYSFFGGLLVILGLILWVKRGGKRRR